MFHDYFFVYTFFFFFVTDSFDFEERIFRPTEMFADIIVEKTIKIPNYALYMDVAQLFFSLKFKFRFKLLYFVRLLAYF